MGKKIKPAPILLRYMDNRRLQEFPNIEVDLSEDTPTAYDDLKIGDHVIVFGVITVSGTIAKLCVASYNDGAQMHWVKTKEENILAPHDLIMYADYEPIHMPLTLGRC